MVEIPWFPDGVDPLFPPNVSIFHRFWGDYYQTYDLIFGSIPVSDNLIRGIANHGKQIGFPVLITRFVTQIERFIPGSDLWVDDYAIKQYEMYRNLLPYNFFLTDPLEIPENIFPVVLIDIGIDYTIHWIQIDNDATWVRRQQTFKTGSNQLTFNPSSCVAIGSFLVVDIDREIIPLESVFGDISIHIDEVTGLEDFVSRGIGNEDTHDEIMEFFNTVLIENYFYACFIPANNNYWNNPANPIEQLGLIPSIYGFSIDEPGDLRNALAFSEKEIIDDRQFSPPNSIFKRSFEDAIDKIDKRQLANNEMEFDLTMPDSIRIKEIHAALNAGFYGNGQEKVITRKDDIYGAPEIADSTLVTIANGEDIELRYTSLAEYLGQVNYLNAALLGLHNFPIQRLPTWQPLGDATEPNLITCFSEYLIVNDYETQIKLGIYPLTTYNYAAFTDAKEPSEVVYSNSGDLLADLYALETRASVLMERSALQTYRTDINTIEIAKAIGSPFKRFEAIWDYGTTDVLQFDGAASLAMGIAGISAYLADNLANTIPLEVQQQADLRRSELMGIE